MNRNLLLLAAVALVSAMAGVLLYQTLSPGRSSQVSVNRLPALALNAIPLTDLADRQTIFDDWKGDILVVNFWAPWCAPCRREIPSLSEIDAEYGARGVRVLGIAFDNKPQVERFASEYAIRYPLFLAANRGPMYNAALGNPSGSLPFTAILDRALKIVFQHNGELTRDQLRSELEKLLTPAGSTANRKFVDNFANLADI